MVQTLLEKIVYEFENLGNSRKAISFSLFIKIATAVAGGSTVDTHEVHTITSVGFLADALCFWSLDLTCSVLQAARLWQIPLTGGQSADGEWERARQTLGQATKPHTTVSDRQRSPNCV